MPYLTIIVPVYNKVKYLNDTIDSILAQSFTDFELILVNDGSTDESGIHCEFYKKKDERVKVIHQQNKGVSAARNTGLNMSQGKYIGFIDSDDTIDVDMYETLINNAKLYEADISICGIKIIHINSSVQKSRVSESVKLYGRDEGLSSLLNGEANWSANNKIYASKFAKSVLFEGRINEDLLYTFLVFKKANAFVLTKSEKYNYIKRENSISLEKFKSFHMESVEVSKKILQMIQNESKKHLDEATVLDFNNNLSLLNMIILHSEEEEHKKEYETLSNNLKNYFGSEIIAKKITKKQQVAFNFFRLSPNAYKVLLKTYCYIFASEVGKKTLN